ncbi:substrate-binding domain-containing protein [Acidocella aromatica]|uniref:ABC-type molybdate transport system substrate-binding protein n=1 Tax=Acidocella aromatica TaxID=1303579 RepID=A0A840VEY3_9PROT|nr:substrate-binding domain-containing protein [Acidocella aromatica]MBB5373447.1 ABC-type molybdate transport system substrate-binding protein [Acidocella aromatica]
MRLVKDFKKLLVLAVLSAMPLAVHAQSQPHGYNDQVFPPWQHGANNDALNKGFDFTVPEVDNMADFHGDLSDPKLVLYVGGNYYFAMAPLVAAFEAANPQYKGHIFYVTIPPGMLAKIMQQGGTITSGNMTFTVKPDAYLAGLKKVQSLIDTGVLSAPAVPYVTNDLTIMVPKGNPAHIESLADLGRPGVKLAMPNPTYEGIGKQIEASLRKAGGDALETQIYQTGVQNGTTILTHIHHRQTPLLLMQGLADAGVTWKSEAIFQEEIGNPISDVPIPPAENSTAIYAGAVVKDAAHPDAAKAWLAFLRSPTALSIFEHYGFKPYTGHS